MKKKVKIISFFGFDILILIIIMKFYLKEEQDLLQHV